MTYLGNKLVHTILGLFLGTTENLEYEVKSKIRKAGKCVILNAFIIHIYHNDYVKYSIFCLIMTIRGVGCRIGCPHVSPRWKEPKDSSLAVTWSRKSTDSDSVQLSQSGRRYSERHSTVMRRPISA